MIKPTLLLLIALSSTPVFAAETGTLRQPYLTSTGQTVPKPGATQDRLGHRNHRERRDDRIDSGICKGC